MNMETQHSQDSCKLQFLNLTLQSWCVNHVEYAQLANEKSLKVIRRKIYSFIKLI